MAEIFHGTNEEWDALVMRHDRPGAFLQSSLWMRVLNSRGYRTARITDVRGEPSLWYLSRIAPFVWAWVCPKGPISVILNEDLQCVTSELDRMHSCVFLRVEPAHEIRGINFVRRNAINPQHTLCTNITRTDSELMASFHEKTRYNIRVAERHGLIARKIGRDEACTRADDLLRIYRSTSSRHAFKSIPENFYSSLFDSADVWCVSNNGKIIATSLHIGFGSIMTYVHGASFYEYRELMAPYLLHWSIMRDARDRGFTKYDWWGVAPSDQKDHPLSGITRFKIGFGGERFDSLGTFDIPIDRARYGLYTVLRRLRP